MRVTKHTNDLVLKAKAFKSCLFDTMSFTISVNVTGSELVFSNVTNPAPLVSVASSKALTSSSLSFFSDVSQKQS